jgi:hypothetical protein
MILRIGGIAVCLFAGYLGFSLSAEINRIPNRARNAAKDTVVQCGKCRITVLGTYFWRDWMPIVRSPGPDGGSPLHVRINLSLDNSSGDVNKLTFRAAIVNDKGQSYSVPFRISPSFGDLAGNVSKSPRIYSIGTPKAGTGNSDGEMWDGGLNPGEIREIELAIADGPYLPVGSSVHVEIECSDKQGNMAVARTPDESIERTD